MNILVPLSNVDDFEILLEAGADEFYCGFVPTEWLKKYGMWAPLNRREFMNASNIYTYSSMRLLRKKIQRYKIPVKITFNSLFYNDEQYDDVLNILQNLIDIGFSTFIIADIGLIKCIRYYNLKCSIHASGEIPIINHHAMNYLNKYNIERFIFPRKTSLDNMRKCIGYCEKRVEYEAFILNQNCQYVGAFCNTLHCDEMCSACFIPSKNVKRSKETNINIIKYLNLLQTEKSKEKKSEYSFARHGCGICYLRNLKNIGINALKVVGRDRDLDSLIRDVEILKMLVENIDKQDFDYYLKEIKQEYFKSGCPNNNLSCYYPQEERKKNEKSFV